MCNFFSAVVKHNGHGSVDIFHSLGVYDGQSHATILKQHNLRDSDHVAKVEFHPRTNEFLLDEEREPIWWDEDIQTSVIEKMKDVLSGWLRPGWKWLNFGQYLDLDNNCKVFLTYDDMEYWIKNDGYHREDGPAIIYQDGREEWWVDNKRHRLGAPAVVDTEGYEEWWVNDKLHRLDGPAVVYHDGQMEWYKDGQHHREGGPAMIMPNGGEQWYKNGQHHREDGPAVIWGNGDEEWWLEGVPVENPGENEEVENV